MATKRQFLREYIKAIRNGNAAVFAGAGLSRPSGVVVWKELLRPLPEEQIAEKRKEHREKKEFKTGVEFLSGITRMDRLSPVCCIVFYHGEEPWKGPTRLHYSLRYTGEL